MLTPHPRTENSTRSLNPLLTLTRPLAVRGGGTAPRAVADVLRPPLDSPGRWDVELLRLHRSGGWRSCFDAAQYPRFVRSRPPPCSRAAEHVGAQGASLPVESIDVYGSAVLDSAAIRSEFEADILRYVATMDRIRLPNADFDEIGKTSLGIRDKLRASLEQRVPLAYLEIAVLTNSAPPPPHINVTIDVVEKADEARRMPFHAAPTRELADPGGLLAAWNELTATWVDLLRSGRQDVTVTAAECPVLHCLAPFTLPEFAPYLERFNVGAREHADALYAVAAESGLDNQRANALLVLAHANDAARLFPGARTRDL